MKSSKNNLTLENVKKLFNEEFDRKLVPVFGELDGLKQQISDVNNGLEMKIDTLRREMKEGFDNVYDGLEILGKDIDHNLEPRIKHLENKVFAQ